MRAQDSGGTRRRVARIVVPLVAAAALSGIAALPASARAASTPDMLPGGITYLRAKSTPATGYVAPRPVQSTRISTVKSTFVVSYHGFPSNAKASFQRAVDLWSVLVKSSQPIRIDATWTPLGPGILGGAGAENYLRNFAGAPQGNTWYPVALANARANQDLDPSDFDIGADFASTRSDWYFGVDGNVPAGKLDFTSVVLHEIGHGLGITDSTDYNGGIGTWGGGTSSPFIYDRLSQSSGGTPLSSYASSSASLGSVLVSNGVRWGGAQGIAANGGTKPRLYSPNPFEYGSSIAHLDEDIYPTGSANALMTPYLDDGEALHDPGDIVLGMLRDEGWTTAGGKGVAAPPVMDTAIGGPAKVILAWTPAIDTGRQFITGYRVYRYDNGAGVASATYDFPAGTTSTTVPSLTNGTAYRFSVATKNGSGYSAESAKTGTIKPVVMGPFTRSDTFVKQQFVDFHNRQATGAEQLTWIANLHSGANTPTTTVTGISKLTGSYDTSTRMTRLYSAYFERLPDFGGYSYWSGKLRAGSSLKKVSDTFAGSSEFKTKYGSLSNTSFVNLVYQNVLHRAPDSGGRDYWVNKLNNKTATRGQVMLNFSESSENTTKMDSEVTSVLLRAGMLRRMPTAGEYAADVALLDGPATIDTLGLQILNSVEYASRF